MDLPLIGYLCGRAETSPIEGDPSGAHGSRLMRESPRARPTPPPKSSPAWTGGGGARGDLPVTAQPVTIRQRQIDESPAGPPRRRVPRPDGAGAGPRPGRGRGTGMNPQAGRLVSE